MKSIGDLPGLRGAFTGCLRIQAAAVPADDLDARMVTQPGGRTLDASIVQDVDDRAALEVDYDGSVARRPPPTPIIDTDYANPTSPFTGFGILDGMLADKQVIIASATGELRRTPALTAASNMYRSTSTIDVQADGTIRGAVEILVSPLPLSIHW